MKTANQTPSIEGYVRETLNFIQAGPTEKERIAADLRLHLQAALEAGEPLATAFERIGSPAELAAAFMSEIPLRYAGFWARAAAAIIDLLAILLGGCTDGGFWSRFCKPDSRET